MTKKITSTFERFMESLSPEERKQYNEEYKEFLLSELILAAMAKDNVSVRQLAKMAGVSPTIVQAMRSGSKTDFSMQSFFKILRGLGSKKIMVELHGQYIPLEIPASVKK
ncbi:MAG TPA: helix-turn-helix domain-containing protein [Candidatus Babeliales bacterium]|nr:helix-turn-helix domain-containing protein [Candidatus Babeliales bacterium]